MNEPKIVFMGTSEFAVATLGALLMNGMNVAKVVTAPDRPAGRGRKLSVSPVKEFSLFSSLSVLQPDNLKDPGFVESLREVGADLFIVVAFRMLPEAVWKIPALGTVNLHASLLPHYRGAAPINRAIMGGETKTGNTTFLIDDKIDTGNILLQEEIDIFPFENAGDVHERLKKQGALLMIRTIMGLTKGTLEPKKQSVLLKPDEKPKPAPKIWPDECVIDWNRKAEEVHNFVRGLAPRPGARSMLISDTKKISYKILESYPEPVPHQIEPGTIESDGKQHLKIACNGGYLNILSVQLEGKKKMGTDEFLRGFDILPYRS